jgi:hypothetical protein
LFLPIHLDSWCPFVFFRSHGVQWGQRHCEKHSKKNQDPIGSSRQSGHVKAICRRDESAAGACGHGTQGPTTSSPLVGAQRVEFVPGIGDVTIVDPAKEAL